MVDNIADASINQSSPQERVQALMLKFLKRKKNISPNPADGFLSTNTTADSETSGEGSNNSTN